MANIGFIGLGVMGFPMASHISRGNHNVYVYNRTFSKAEKWEKKFKGTASSLESIAKNCDFIFSCVGNDEDLKEITLGEKGVFKNMKKESFFIDHTTSSSKAAIEVNEVALQYSINFLDAPVSGGQSGAENGELTVMCGGTKINFEKVKPLIESYSKKCVLIGEVGSGQLAKMVNQICIAGLIQGLSEGLAFAEKSGLDSKKVLNVIKEGAAGSWQMSNRGETMIQRSFDFGFAVDLMRKDLKICLDQAEKIGASLPITALVDQFYNDIQLNNGGKFDTSSLITRL